MNVALPALVVFACLLPGFLFRSRLKLVESTSLDYSPFGRVVTEGVFWAVALHLVWIAAICPLVDQKVDLGLLLQLLSSNLTIHGDAVKSIGADLYRVGWYFASLYTASFLVPTGIRWLIARSGADRIGAPFSKFLRFDDAPWYYLLTGADLAPEDKPDLIIATAIISIAGEAYLFKGVLNYFYFKSDGSLDRLVLEQTMRRPLSKYKDEVIQGEKVSNADVEGEKMTEKANPPSRFSPIDGDSFVIQYDQVLTLNIQYLKLTEAG